MAKITQARKHKPFVDGELFSVGANNFINGAWKAFQISFRQYDKEGYAEYTTLKIDRAEAERLVKSLSEYLAGKALTD